MTGRTIALTASLTPEDGGYVARCLELDVTTEGDTLDQALAMLREAVELYLDDEPLSEPVSYPFITSFELTLGHQAPAGKEGTAGTQPGGGPA